MEIYFVGSLVYQLIGLLVYWFIGSLVNLLVGLRRIKSTKQSYKFLHDFFYF